MNRIVTILMLLAVVPITSFGQYRIGFDRSPTFDTIQLNTNFTDGHVVGRLQWNDDDKTIEFGLGGGNVNLQVGLENVFIGVNKTGSTIANGTPVAIVGAQGQRAKIAPADADHADERYRRVVGVTTEAITNNLTGYVTSEGIVRELNTSAFDDGAELFISTAAGQFTTNHPAAPTDAFSVGIVRNSHNNQGEIQVKVHPCLHWSDMDTRYYQENDSAVLSNLTITGNITLTNTVWDDLTISSLNLIDPQGPIDSARLVQVTNNLYGLEFVAGNVGLGRTQMTHRYKPNTAIVPHIHTTHTNELTKTNTWVMSMTWGRINQGFTNHWTGEVTVTNAGTVGGVKLHKLVSFGEVANSIGTVGESTVFGIVVSNKSTSTASGILGDIDIHYEADKIGSDNEIPNGL